jgi:LPXTG-motif cell wall-anchored protein
MKITGIIIVFAGLGLTLFTAFSDFFKEKIFKAGSIEITRIQPHYFNWPPFIGIAIMVVGLLIFFQAKKKKNRLG